MARLPTPLDDARDPDVPNAQVATRSGLYSVVASGGCAVLGLVRSIAVARILAPEEFGRFVLVATILGVLDIASQPGLESAALQQGRLRQRTLQTLWSALILRAAFLTLALLAIAEPLANWFGAPDSAGLLRGIAFVPLVRSFASLAVLARAHKVDLAPQARLQLSAQGTETVVSVVACAVTGSANGLVLGLLAGAAVELVGSWQVSGFRPRFCLAAGELWPLVRFGRWVFASNVLGFLSTNGDDLVVGRVAGAGPLGLYRAAYRLANLPTVQLSHALSRVAFPALSRLQDVSPATRNEVFLRYLRLTTAVAGVLGAAVTATASDLVVTLLGEAWSGAATPLSIMAGAGVIRAVVGTGGTYFLAGARPQLDTWMQMVRVAVLASGIALLLPLFGISGVAAASLLSVIAIVPGWLFGLRRFGLGCRRVLAEVAGPLLIVITSGVAGSVVASLVPGPLPAVLLAAVAVFGTWLLMIWRLQPSLRRELELVVEHLKRNGRASDGE